MPLIKGRIIVLMDWTERTFPSLDQKFLASFALDAKAFFLTWPKKIIPNY